MEQEECLENVEEPDTIWAEHVEQLSWVWKLEVTFFSDPFTGETKDMKTIQPGALAAESTQHKKDTSVFTLFPCASQNLNVRWLYPPPTQNSTRCVGFVLPLVFPTVRQHLQVFPDFIEVHQYRVITLTCHTGTEQRS